MRVEAWLTDHSQRCKRLRHLPAFCLNEVQQLLGRAHVFIVDRVGIDRLEVVDGVFNLLGIGRRFPRFLRKNPDLLFRLTPGKEPQFPAFAAKVKPMEFAPGVTRGTGSMPSADWMVRWADGLEPTPQNLNLRSLLGGGGEGGGSRTFRFASGGISGLGRIRDDRSRRAQ